MKNLKRLLGASYPIIIFLPVNLVVLSLSRLGLSLWQSERVDATQGWAELFIQGMRVDLSSLCWLFFPLILLGTLFSGNNKFGKIIQWIIKLGLTVFSTFFVFMELATPAFIKTYDYRPNRLFVEYLNTPKEVFTMLVHGHLAALISTVILTALFAIIFWKFAQKLSRDLYFSKWQYRPVLFLILGLLTFIGARSSFEHRTLNPSMVAFSNDTLVNSLVLNSGYSVLFAVQQMKDESTSSEIYGKMPLEEVVNTLKGLNPRPETAYISAELPTLTHNQASYQGKPKNLVILLQESLGAQFIGTLGGKPLSPNIDELAKEGWLFDNLYATGTRSVRGIEAIITGFTPTPARAVVKLQGSQNNFFTIADLLKQQGYDTSFIYGGEKHFDNMASFFYGNGFTRIIDQADYSNPTFSGTWGVSDEDLLNKANETFESLHQQGKPFFSLVFSSSNHDPFEFPEGKIQLYEQPQATRNNAAKYADYALGEFFKKAKQANYWKDTVFIIIADHDSRVNGQQLVPIKHFHIPALILGADIEPKRDHRLISQIDIPPTLLSLIGISGDYPMIGFDLTKAENPNRALMQFDKNLAYMRDNRVAILQPNKPATGFIYDEKTGDLTAASIPENMAKEALAYALWGSYAYKNKLYKSDYLLKK